MAHRHRRTLATPDPHKPSIAAPTAVRRPHRTTNQPPPPPAVKALSVSVNFDSSISKPNRQLRTPPNLEKETSRAAKPSSTKFKDKELKVDLNSNMRKLSVSLDGGGGGRRRSMGGGCAQVEVADFLAKNGAKIVSVDMPPFMQIHAVDVARKTRDSLEKFTARTLASALKKEFDGVYGPAWHCIVGTSFGSFVTHSVGGFLYFSLDQNINSSLEEAKLGRRSSSAELERELRWPSRRRGARARPRSRPPSRSRPRSRPPSRSKIAAAVAELERELRSSPSLPVLAAGVDPYPAVLGYARPPEKPSSEHAGDHGEDA